jgi:hypothetical protein
MRHSLHINPFTNERTATLTPNLLPIQPEITPGFGIAGAILIATGVLYTFVGIRNRWLHIYLSTAYLVSISITVLIIYVMNPPVSSAIQGAYLVAVVIPGLLIGGCALIFTDMTEGLGCLLGGFCFSMWLLVMKKGGLITSTSGKSVLIAVISVAAFSLSFSHYTRSYGLIACISFAGATAVVLGIDCFSRAGLKEFWAYLWNLNENLFPLGATTYPLTRGIRVEIAAIFIIFLAGVISQSKFYKLIQDRRAQHLAEKEADRRALNEEELNVGRRVEDQNHVERKRWEKAYGDSDWSNADSSRDSAVCDMESSKRWPASTVTSVRQSNEDAIEMVEIPLEEEAGGLLMSETAIRNEAHPTQLPNGLGNVIERIDEESSVKSRRRSQTSNEPHVDGEVATEQAWVVGTGGEAQLKRRPSQRLSTSDPKPAVTATPDIAAHLIKVSEDATDDGRSSIAAFADEETLENSNIVKRVSSGSSALLARMSRGSLRNSKRYSGKAASTEALVVQDEIEDDRASSLAATMDGFSDDEHTEAGSLRSHFVGQDPTGISDAGEDTSETQPILHSAVQHSGERSRAGSSMSTTRASGGMNSQDETVRIQNLDIKSSRRASSATVATEVLDMPQEDEDPKGLLVQSSSAQNIPSKNSQTPEVAPDNAGREGNKSTASPEESHSETPVAYDVPRKITKDSLPAQLSRVVMSYRTNEWAKHLSNADSPDMEELGMGEKNIDESDIEAAAPLDVEALQQTVTSSARPAASRSSSQPSNHPLHLRSNSNHSNIVPFAAIPEDSTVNDGMPRNYAQRPSQGQQPNRSYRSSSNPTPSYRATDNQANDPSQRHLPQTSTNIINTLMGKRDTMIRNRSSQYPPQVSQSRSYAPTPALDNFHSTSTSDAGSIHNQPTIPSQALPSDADDLPLSHRRALLHQSSLLQPSAHTQPTNFNSHQPRRQSSAPSPMAREQQLASWRASVAQDLQAQSRKEVKDMERQRNILWQERQQEEQRRLLEMRRKGQKERQKDERIRMSGGGNGGNLEDLHRRMLGRMQEEARGNL